MNQINPKKLRGSKWTAVSPVNKEKHFLITDVAFDEDGNVIHCEIEAVMSNRLQAIDWRQLKDHTIWLQGWQ
ncbi:TIGR02450 family Trp-rich protein [Pseudoalteromonas sp. AOP31-A2-14]|uniref:TIGR02450 family Trp-rich protein n=1 Tax=Pseudoalteromonas sp. AOP31-A2-14 TaxID=3457695 RepID=UPI003FB74DFE